MEVNDATKFPEIKIKISQYYLTILSLSKPGLRVGGESQLSQIYEVTAEVTEELKRTRLIVEQMR